jgi:hypothetical protein
MSAGAASHAAATAVRRTNRVRTAFLSSTHRLVRVRQHNVVQRGVVEVALARGRLQEARRGAIGKSRSPSAQASIRGLSQTRQASQGSIHGTYTAHGTYTRHRHGTYTAHTHGIHTAYTRHIHGTRQAYAAHVAAPSCRTARSRAGLCVRSSRLAAVLGFELGLADQHVLGDEAARARRVLGVAREGKRTLTLTGRTRAHARTASSPRLAGPARQ